MEFCAEQKTELNRTRLRLKVDGLYTEDYQIRMIQENQISGLIPVKVLGEGEYTIYEYDITGLVSLKQYYRQKKITREEMYSFLKQIQEVMDTAESYLLNPNRLLLREEYIFCEDGKYSFCYFPQGEEDIGGSFHRLMDAFVQWTDYQDISSVKTAFFLHKETMKENYSLKRVIKKLELLEKEKKECGDKRKEDRETEDMALETELIQHDWIAHQETGSRILKETDNLWSPVKRLLQRHKRPKWGEWDGIYIDEEDL